MKNIVVVMFFLSFCLSSCKKENVELPDKTLESIGEVDVIEIQGVAYGKDSVFNEMSKVTGFPVSEIYFDSNSQMFRIKSFELSEFKAEDYLLLNR